jgi:hypothetical protein
VGHRNCLKYSGLAKPTDVTIHWKALADHFLILSLISFSVQPFGEGEEGGGGEGIHFLNFPQRISVLKGIFCTV